MNFLNNIKESLGKVSISLKGQNENSKTPETNNLEYAGAELLIRFQSYWKAIHDENRQSAELAIECDHMIQAFQQKTKENSELIEKLQTHCNTLPSILHQVNTAYARLKHISNQCESIENDITTLQCLNIKASYAARRRRKRQEFQGHSLVKKTQLEVKRREQLDSTRKEVERMEEEVRRRVQERHHTFEMEHLQQMQIYKETGEIPICDGLQLKEGAKSLEEMHLDLEKEELEEFLKDVKEAGAVRIIEGCSGSAEQEVENETDDDEGKSICRDAIENCDVTIDIDRGSV